MSVETNADNLSRFIELIKKPRELEFGSDHYTEYFKCIYEKFGVEKIRSFFKEMVNAIIKEGNETLKKHEKDFIGYSKKAADVMSGHESMVRQTLKEDLGLSKISNLHQIKKRKKIKNTCHYLCVSIDYLDNLILLLECFKKNKVGCSKEVSLLLAECREYIKILPHMLKHCVSEEDIQKITVYSFEFIDRRYLRFTAKHLENTMLTSSNGHYPLKQPRIIISTALGEGWCSKQEVKSTEGDRVEIRRGRASIGPRR